MRIVYNSFLFKFPPLCYYDANVLGRWMHTRFDEKTVPARLIKHELVHQKQMDEHGVIMFYLIYVKDYIKNLFKYKNHWDAYYNIPFEIEAYQKEMK